MDESARDILRQRLAEVRERIGQAARRAGRRPEDVAIVAVTKSVSAAVAALLPELGICDLGENRPQELWKKAALVPQVRWHLIGHLQRNKIDRTVPLATLIHSVDSQRLLEALDAFGRRHARRVPVLLQFNCSREANKQGFAPEQADTLAEQLPHYSGLEVLGLMTMAALTGNPADARPAFAELRQLRDRLHQQSGLPLPHLSMGMSHDFDIAVEEGATLVRLGTVLLAGLEDSHSK